MIYGASRGTQDVLVWGPDTTPSLDQHLILLSIINLDQPDLSLLVYLVLCSNDRLLVFEPEIVVRDIAGQRNNNMEFEGAAPEGRWM